jgi:hypothetical protein
MTMIRCAVGWLTLVGWGLVVALGFVKSVTNPAAAGRVQWPLDAVTVQPTWVLFASPRPQDPPKTKPYRRVLPPKFDPQRVERTFFDDVFSRTVGERPKVAETAAAPAAPATTPAVPADGPAPTANPGGSASLISATTLEDEIKSLKLDIDKIVTTPASFVGSGHKEARVKFALLALLFDTIATKEGEVRWKGDAAAASAAFARVAANLKAGGSTQVYNEAKKRKQDLADLVSGARFPDSAAGGPTEPFPVDRVPLMQILEQRFEANLKSWTANDAEFKAHVDQLVHEAELTALIGSVLARPGSEDADDADYQKFAQLLEQGAAATMAAARQQDPEAARKAVTDVSRSCTDCHENYR